MIPITLAPTGTEIIIRQIRGNDEVKRHLESLGFAVGGRVTIISTLAGSIILKVKESRVAIGKDMAMKIFV